MLEILRLRKAIKMCELALKSSSFGLFMSLVVEFALSSPLLLLSVHIIWSVFECIAFNGF